MSQTKTLTFSKVDFCPSCQRKLCKRTTIDNVPQIEFKHKGAEILGQEMTIRCIGCGKKFIVMAQSGIVDEVA